MQQIGLNKDTCPDSFCLHEPSVSELPDVMAATKQTNLHITVITSHLFTNAFFQKMVYQHLDSIPHPIPHTHHPFLFPTEAEEADGNPENSLRFELQRPLSGCLSQKDNSGESLTLSDLPFHQHGAAEKKVHLQSLWAVSCLSASDSAPTPLPPSSPLLELTAVGI